MAEGESAEPGWLKYFSEREANETASETAARNGTKLLTQSAEGPPAKHQAPRGGVRGGTAQYV